MFRVSRKGTLGAPIRAKGTGRFRAGTGGKASWGSIAVRRRPSGRIHGAKTRPKSYPPRVRSPLKGDLQSRLKLDTAKTPSLVTTVRLFQIGIKLLSRFYAHQDALAELAERYPLHNLVQSNRSRVGRVAVEFA
jgi:hypothetical protein